MVSADLAFWRFKGGSRTSDYDALARPFSPPFFVSESLAVPCAHDLDGRGRTKEVAEG